MNVDFVICALCHTNQLLTTFPIVKPDGGIIGFYYICRDCLPEFSKKAVCIGILLKSAFIIKLKNDKFLYSIDKDKKAIIKTENWGQAHLFNTKEEAEHIMNLCKIDGEIKNYIILES